MPATTTCLRGPTARSGCRRIQAYRSAGATIGSARRGSRQRGGGARPSHARPGVLAARLPCAVPALDEEVVRRRRVAGRATQRRQGRTTAWARTPACGSAPAAPGCRRTGRARSRVSRSAWATTTGSSPSWRRRTRRSRPAAPPQRRPARASRGGRARPDRIASAHDEGGGAGRRRRRADRRPRAGRARVRRGGAREQGDSRRQGTELARAGLRGGRSRRLAGRARLPLLPGLLSTHPRHDEPDPDRPTAPCSTG